MISLSKQQIAERWDSLPDALHDALVSEANSDFLWEAGESEHIPEKNIRTVAMVASHVLMGFIHPEDVAKALQESISIDQKTATSIEGALNQRIFAPIREQIDAVYSPLSKFEMVPKILQEIKPPQTMAPLPTPAPKPPAPQIISESFMASPRLGTTPLASNQNKPDTPPPAPKPAAKAISETGWSTRTPQNPVVTLGAITPAVPSPSTSSPTTKTSTVDLSKQTRPTTANPAVPGMRSMSEFERLDLSKKNNSSASMPPTTAPKPTVAPAQPQPSAPAFPRPVMLHEISASTAQSPEFHVNMGAQNQMGGNVPRPPMPTRPAVLEFGGASPSSSSASQNSPAPKPPQAAVHYSQYEAPKDVPRQITEITRPANTAATTPSAMPTPPKPPASSSEKVIVKDFLGPEK